jgi:hypothetical protein
MPGRIEKPSLLLSNDPLGILSTHLLSFGISALQPTDLIIDLQSSFVFDHPKGDRPYDQLDGLYADCFGCRRSWSPREKICLVLGIIYFQNKGVGIFHAPRLTIEELLEMKAGDLVLLLDPILSPLRLTVTMSGYEASPCLIIFWFSLEVDISLLILAHELAATPEASHYE